MDTTFIIKNMVCDRCIASVTVILRQAGMVPLSVLLGCVRVQGVPAEATIATLRELLAQAGFELIDEQRQQTAELIRTAIVQMVHHGQEDPAANLSANITRLTHCDYASASRVFSEVTGTTIERYYIHQRIERVKELLQYGQLTLSEIALQMHYSSTAYLSAQFKSITGLTPTQYKAQQTQPRQSLDRL